MTHLEHLGDGCYVGYDGYHIVLMANSHDNPTDTVSLDPYVWARLLRWKDRLNDDTKPLENDA